MAPKLATSLKADKLTARQQNILDYLISFVGEHGYPPSMREIGEFFGIRSTNGVSDHLRALERKGFISRSAQKGRGLQLLPKSGAPATRRTVSPRRSATPTPGMVDVPVLGRVAAGVPLLAVELAEERLSLSEELVPSGAFALRVNGRSMIEAGILPEDLLFVRPQARVDNGEIAVVMVDGEATVKRWYDEGSRVRLQPENRSMEPIFVHADQEISVLGKVVGVWRGIR